MIGSLFVSGSGLDKLVSSLSDLNLRLDSRKKVLPAVFSENMKLREETHHLGMTLSLQNSLKQWVLISVVTIYNCETVVPIYWGRWSFCSIPEFINWCLWQLSPLAHQ